jgi:hypothetical protein
MQPYEPKIPSIEKLRSFLDLPEGWCYQKGRAPSRKTVNAAVKLIEEASLSLASTDVFPGADGEIQVSVYHKDHYLEFIIEPDYFISFVHEYGGEEVACKERLDLSEAVQELNFFGKEIWNLSELSTLCSSTISSRDSQVWLSRILQAEGGYLYFSTNAPIEPAATYADTSEDIMRPSQVIHHSSGLYPPRSYLLDGVSGNTPVRQAMTAMEIY